ncbi:hypothetical protein [Nonomuraea roseola]|uniref:WXG100 family type VII secretion target n=1 Tax=Nonomuraea roseola TaxID=46179 RepID=A0ABV5PQF7_9ACTN
MSKPPLDLDLDQLLRSAAPAFHDIGSDFHDAVLRAVDALSELRSWPMDEETDRNFVRWYAPKSTEMLDLLGQLAGAYGDVAEKLLVMRHNVVVTDWGTADDLKLEDVPAYQPPRVQDLIPRGPMP